MAKFEAALVRTLAHEGGYVWDPDDPGGETFRGIAREYWPKWRGWQVIDAAKTGVEWRRGVEEDPQLFNLVKSFYRERFWEPIQGDRIQDGAQEIAEELFDCAVNPGVQRAAEMLQAALNLLNRGGALYDDLVVDGIIGPQTLGALEAFLRHDPPEVLLTAFKILRGYYFLERARQNERKEKFVRGWLRRTMM